MQPRISDQCAYLLHRRDFRENSLLLELFTRDYGRVTLVARGARKRRNTAHFQPFNQLRISWSGGGELKTLTHIESRPVAVATDCYLPVYYLNELLLYLLPRQDDYVELFGAYDKLLCTIDSSNMEPKLREFEIRLLRSLGLMPDLDTIAISGLDVEPDNHYRVRVNAGVEAAGPEDAPVFTGSELLSIQRMDFSTPQIQRAARRLLRQIIDFNLQGRTLQSRQLYQRLKRTS